MQRRYRSIQNRPSAFVNSSCSGPLYGCLITLVLHHRVFRVRRTASGDNLSFRFKEYPTGRTIYRIGLSRSFLHSLTRPAKLALPASPGGGREIKVSVFYIPQFRNARAQGDRL